MCGHFLVCLFVCLSFSSFANSGSDLSGRFRLHEENYSGDDQIMPVGLILWSTSVPPNCRRTRVAGLLKEKN